MKILHLAGALALAAILCASPAAADSLTGLPIKAPAGFAPAAAIACDDGTGTTGPCKLDVQSAAPSSGTVTITSGGSLSGGIDLGAQRAVRLHIPSAGWTSAAITFQVAYGTCATYADLYDSNGEVTLSSSVAAAGRSIVLDPATFYGAQCIKVRSGTGAAPVNQAADRIITIVTGAR